MKRVTILLSSYNGEAYLEEQLESIAAQKDVQTNILVRDDGSSDRRPADHPGNRPDGG